MSVDGKQLESLVAFVERQLLPEGFEVKSNEKVFNDDGIQIAEFDIEIRGKVGTTTIAWLIECRDRPGQGAAPGAWIEQLVGRKTRFGFNKVTAVSTTGFAAGAVDFARQQGIELREVRSLNQSEFNWLQITAMEQVLQISDLKHANIFLAPDQPDALQRAALQIVKSAKGSDPLLFSALRPDKATLAQAFLGAVQSVPDAFSLVTPQHSKNVRLVAKYPTTDQFCIQTSEGPARIAEIEFLGELRIESTLIPVIETIEYRHAESGESISQVAVFQPQSIGSANIAVELHHFTESGFTSVAIRRLADD